MTVHKRLYAIKQVLFGLIRQDLVVEPIILLCLVQASGWSKLDGSLYLSACRLLSYIRPYLCMIDLTYEGTRYVIIPLELEPRKLKLPLVRYICQLVAEIWYFLVDSLQGTNLRQMNLWFCFQRGPTNQATSGAKGTMDSLLGRMPPPLYLPHPHAHTHNPCTNACFSLLNQLPKPYMRYLLPEMLFWYLWVITVFIVYV